MNQTFDKKGRLCTEWDDKGNWCCYYKNGQLQENCKPDGSRKSYWRNGKIHTIVTTNQNTVTGFNEEGNITYKRIHEGRKKIDTWYYDYDDGKIMQQIIVDGDEFILKTIF